MKGNDDFHVDCDHDFAIKNKHDSKRERIVNLSKKPLSSLKPEDIFEIINHDIELEKFIPEALNLIENKCIFRFDNPSDDEYCILDKKTIYFNKNPHQGKKYEKLKLWRKNSGNCLNPNNNKPRKSYISEAHALGDAVREFNSDAQSAYKCDYCGGWHLISSSRNTPSINCEYCTDEKGENKKLYTTKEAAQKRADLIYKERDIFLNVYECPHSNGWHLTKKRK
jgi:DNA-directed RNA polymerase subunit RPC12/RpoP